MFNYLSEFLFIVSKIYFSNILTLFYKINEFHIKKKMNLVFYLISSTSISCSVSISTIK
jgi:hypothetical protein